MPYNLRSKTKTDNTRYFNTPIDPNPEKINTREVSNVVEVNDNRSHNPGYHKTEWVMDSYENVEDEVIVLESHQPKENIKNLIKNHEINDINDNNDVNDNNNNVEFEITGLEKLRQDYEDRSQSVPYNFESNIDHSHNGFTWNANQTWPSNEWVNDYDYSNDIAEFNSGFDHNENEVNENNNYINPSYEWTTDYDYDYNDNLYQWAQDTHSGFKMPVKTDNMETQTENESVTTDQETQTDYDTKPDMNPVNQIIAGGTLFYRVSICGKTYIAIEDVFKYVTLGGSLPKQDLEYLRDDVNNYIYGKDYIFSEDQKIRVVSNFGNFMKDQSPDIIETVRYEMKDYRLIAKVCLDYAYRYNKYIAY